MNELREYAREYGISLTDKMLSQFVAYERLLLEWNARMNLTAITDHRDVVIKHFLDSLIVLAAHSVPQGARVLDVGTGAGFPGIPLKIARPDLRLTLMDSLRKRIGFLSEVSAAIGCEDIRCIHSRAEDLARDPDHRERYDLVTARAVAALPVLLEYCLPFVRVGGVFLAMKGGEVEAETASAEKALALLGGKVASQYAATLPDDSARTILVLEKSSRIPSKYPRKAVKIAKNPL